jgi:hypothetical protein
MSFVTAYILEQIIFSLRFYSNIQMVILVLLSPIMLVAFAFVKLPGATLYTLFFCGPIRVDLESNKFVAGEWNE